MEWLVADQYGYFAMGTSTGTRTRKYHGFLAGIAGRAEKNLLAQLDLTCNDQPLWTHAYQSSTGFVEHPDGAKRIKAFRSRPWPAWIWELDTGALEGELSALAEGGFRLALTWRGKERAKLLVRPLWAMRPLHGLGASATSAVVRATSIEFGGEACIETNLPFQWTAETTWYRNFFYAEEKARGYDSVEDLHSAGHLELTLSKDQTLHLDILHGAAGKSRAPRARKTPLEDFVLRNPAGVVAGFPWFGEWGRDSFIALPGITAGLADADQAAIPEIASWTIEALERWSGFLEREGMLPNVITPEGPQWESSDATLWWTHSLAALWAFGLSNPRLGLAEPLARRFKRPLELAIDSIERGRHRYLSVDGSGLLRTSGDSTTWMDARVEGKAATPRNGFLPEINALWFQARCLRTLWTGSKDPNLIQIAKSLLERAHEKERPNIVFFHSLPLAPSFVLSRIEAMRRDAHLLADSFATPVGLRTLAPGQPQYNACYDGAQPVRDRCYHQGPVWGWLKGHYEMALQRFARAGIVSEAQPTARGTQLSTIDGHFAELFDAEAPFAVRGAPAQAWSLACAEESRLRKAWNVDDRLQAVIREISS